MTIHAFKHKICNDCKLDFDSKKGLMKHLSEHHERKTKWLQTGLEIDWKYGMTGDEHKACAEVTSNHFQR